MLWVLKDPQAHIDMLGLIPYFIHDDDEDTAAKQFAKRYVAGWKPRPGFIMKANSLIYTANNGDRDVPLRLIAEAKLRDETIRFYDSAWVAVVQPDGSFEVSRMD
jgi:hypothetical protein